MHTHSPHIHRDTKVRYTHTTTHFTTGRNTLLCTYSGMYTHTHTHTHTNVIYTIQSGRIQEGRGDHTLQVMAGRGDSELEGFTCGGRGVITGRRLSGGGRR